MRAIVLDFYGTLSHPGREAGRRAAHDKTAQILGIDPDDFWGAVCRSFTERAAGALGGTAETLVELARRCGVRPSDNMLAAAVDAQLEGASWLQAPRPGALEVLAELKDRGYALGLLSDCSSELCELWLDSVYQPFFDATVFSWDEGYRKPDPRGYLCVAAKLRVDPSECWYVGDGSSRELSGALRLQMRPVLVTNETYPDHARYRKDPDPFTPEDVIADITDLPDYVVACEPASQAATS